MFEQAEYLILGNWKMNLNIQDAKALADSVVKAASALPKHIATGVCPASLHLAQTNAIFQNSSVALGAQDCHFERSGAFTGDISAAQLKDIGCSFTLLGHSERRQFHQESDQLVHKKAEAALNQNLHAVICIGETLEERESGRYTQVLETQIKNSLPAIGTRDTISIAYEPIWAIGTGRTAESQDIEETHRFIREILKQIYSKATPRILYGGSVKANNALEILSLSVVDGVLVGGASLDAEAFATIMRAAASVATASV